ncbi:glycine/betaine ABC transporter [Labrys sp. WJW]|uniref:glycine betaine ABC transporter substrate-binding protein n=1 Tax=Labrys sp. WJW TaxID=1737983 RepID=UPI00082A9F22|nr:glycine betaine ABC transporter substrate-binding protein [Labrys sp. WJW]OCC03654.1 glycine/betaine ABC transporter [Labrys sp. WJW]
MRSIMRALGALAVLGLSLMSAHADEKTIKLGTMAWEDMLPITGVAKKALEDKGYKVEVTQFSEWGIAYAALTKGDVEVMVSQVDYVAQDYWKKNKSRLEKISITSHGLYQAFAVPSYVDAKSIEDLNANADKFGGKIIGIEPGSGLMREAGKAIKDYNLKLQLVEGSTAGMTASLKSAFDRKEPIVVTLWDPTWMFQKFEMKFLADPKHVFSPPQSYNLIAKKGFSEEKPEAREILAGVYLPLDQIRAINTAVADGKTMDQAIQDWVAANDALIKRWEDVKNY